MDDEYVSAPEAMRWLLTGARAELHQELLRIAFKDRLVDRLDHPVVKRLRGLS